MQVHCLRPSPLNVMYVFINMFHPPPTFTFSSIHYILGTHAIFWCVCVCRPNPVCSIAYSEMFSDVRTVIGRLSFPWPFPSPFPHCLVSLFLHHQTVEVYLPISFYYKMTPFRFLSTPALCSGAQAMDYFRALSRANEHSDRVSWPSHRPSLALS